MLWAGHAVCLLEGPADEGAVAIDQGAAVIAVLDYGAGNLRSVENALEELGCRYTLVRDAAGLRAAEKILLPGVGHFGQMMRSLDALKVREMLRERIVAGVPFLGICLGMQALFEGIDEAPEERGLGIFAGRVVRFPAGARVPHMGWNRLEARGQSRLLSGAGARPYVYFAHSYYVPEMEHAAATCTYGVRYTAALECGSIFGVQFHPEKSGDVGLGMVRNFVS
jgi:imidazole glycerol phosphate synthase glutamine amidotransferase subunit